MRGGHTKNLGELGWAAAAAAGPQTQRGLLEVSSLETSRLSGLGTCHSTHCLKGEISKTNDS